MLVRKVCKKKSFSENSNKCHFTRFFPWPLQIVLLRFLSAIYTLHLHSAIFVATEFVRKEKKANENLMKTSVSLYPFRIDEKIMQQMKLG